MILGKSAATALNAATNAASSVVITADPLTPAPEFALPYVLALLVPVSMSFFEKKG